MRWIGLMVGLALTAAAPVTSATYRWVEWRGDRPPLTIGEAGATATIRATPCDSRRFDCTPADAMTTPVVEVRAPGLPPTMLTGEATGRSMAHFVGIGRLAKDAPPSVILNSYSGGAHCCQHILVATPAAARIDVVDMGSWDGDTIAWPRDLSGDGIADFRISDNAFLYAFGCYACSYAPPRVLTIRQGRKVDISAEPGLRPLFAADLAQVRPLCLKGDRAACAAYVADAARLGRTAYAWREMLRHYARQDSWPLYTECRRRSADGSCPPDQTIRYATYPEALAAFLKRAGYIPDGARLPLR
ncbi:hypothetical protein GCM10011380_15770 [Sphingomonas metalli]|uniref:Uncharacterized protein n=1 Tax=Sphingomonas metalli TaxID=1779358 RepID=A0A916T0Q9_9SPHN|nr:hypothetical protein [Sphingomonas metalli]GGB27010.1 hypothetical protein GCM10011380_15770 [Sphingomonas metalli]